MVLIEKNAWDTWIKVVSESTEFLYIISPWIGPKFAKTLTELAGAKDVKIIMRDGGLSNIDSIRYFEQVQFEVRILATKHLHSKFLITEKYLIKGSANYTHQSFFKEENCIELYERGTPEWNEYYQRAQKNILESRILPPISTFLKDKIDKMINPNPDKLDVNIEVPEPIKDSSNNNTVLKENKSNINKSTLTLPDIDSSIDLNFKSRLDNKSSAATTGKTELQGLAECIRKL